MVTAFLESKQGNMNFELIKKPVPVRWPCHLPGPGCGLYHFILTTARGRSCFSFLTLRVKELRLSCGGAGTPNPPCLSWNGQAMMGAPSGSQSYLIGSKTGEFLGFQLFLRIVAQEYWNFQISDFWIFRMFGSHYLTVGWLGVTVRGLPSWDLWHSRALQPPIQHWGV